MFNKQIKSSLSKELDLKLHLLIPQCLVQIKHIAHLLIFNSWRSTQNPVMLGKCNFNVESFITVIFDKSSKIIK